MSYEGRVIIQNIIESFRRAKTDIIKFGKALTEVSNNQVSIIEEIGKIREEIFSVKTTLTQHSHPTKSDDTKSELKKVTSIVREISGNYSNLLRELTKTKLRLRDAEIKIAALRKQKPVTIIKKVAPRTVKVVRTKPVVKKTVVRKKYVSAKTGKNVHELNCIFARNIKPKNRIVFKTKARAFNQGFKACDCMKRI